MKKLLSMILALSLIASLATVSAGAVLTDGNPHATRTERVELRNTTAHSSASCDRFSDVSANFWGRGSIAYVVDKGLFNGTSSNTFAPNDTMNRAMLVTALYRYAGSPAVSGSSTYTDVKAGTWYSDAFTWAQKNSILPYWRLNGSKIEPEAGVERGEFAVMLRNFFLYSGGDSFNDAINGIALIFKDLPDSSSNKYAGTIVPAIAWAYTYSILDGTGKNTMAPFEQVTRAQLAAMLERYDRQFVDADSGELDDPNKLDEEAIESIEDEIIRLINEYRVENGLTELKKNEQLMKAADIRAKEMSVKFGHTRPDGTFANTVLSEVGMSTWGCFVENGSAGATSALSVVGGWKKSPGHNESMLTRAPVTDIAVGYYLTDSGDSYCAMIFAMDYGY